MRQTLFVMLVLIVAGRTAPGADREPKVYVEGGAGNESLRTLPTSNMIGASRTVIVEGMTKAKVLAALGGDWRGDVSVPDAVMRRKDVWEVTEPYWVGEWIIGRHFMSIQFQGGVVKEVSECWLAP